MSYVHYDHAGWVESNAAAAKCFKMTAKGRKLLAEHKGWFAAPEVLTPFQRRAFHVLGIVGNGIYNAPISWDTLYWAPNAIICSWYNSLATWDFMALTRFVFLCHEGRIRGSIAPNRPRHIEISLHERVATGSMSLRHPSLDEAIAEWRKEFPADHPIVYRGPPPTDHTEAAA